MAEIHVDEEEVGREVKKASTTTNVLICKPSIRATGVYLRYFSSYVKILKMIAWLNRFVVNSRNKRKESRCLDNYVKSNEINAAEILLIRLVQREMFFNEKDDKLKSLNAFWDEHGLLRVKTKIFYRDDDENFRCPILLDPSHSIVELIIREEHYRLGHAGTQTVLCKLREKFWILTARRRIRAVLSKCIRCKRYEVKRMEAVSIPLPLERVRDAAVFEIIGVDLAGPLFLKNSQKAYICILTCAVFRAVHLELLSSLSTTDFIKGFTRFVARRGRPVTVFSDNGINFVGTDNDLKELNWNTIAEYSSTNRIEWCFNPPSAAWWGGWWERIVELVKRLLRRIIAKASVKYEDMYTILCDCEAIINSRPLTYVSSDCNDLATLTPNLFLQEIREIGVPDLDAVASIDLRGRSRYCQKLKDDLRQRFRSEYLGQLRENAKLKESRNLNVGDLVLIGHEDQKSIDWLLGRILSVIEGRDAKARAYRIKTQNGELTRPIQRLYPLELHQPVAKENKDVLNNIANNKIREKCDKPIKNKKPEECSEKLDNHSTYVTRSSREVQRNSKFEC